MTSTAVTQPLPTSPASRDSGRSGGIAAIVVGAVLALLGSLGAMAGGTLLAAFGSDSTVGSGQHTFATSTRAIVSDVADLSYDNDVAEAIGRPRFRMSVKAAAAKNGVFVGLGPTAKVERYLDGVSVDEVSDFDVAPFHLDREHNRGTRRPKRPSTQDFWVAKDAGTASAAMNWKVRDGRYRLVIMNRDGSRGVNTQGKASLKIAYMSEVSWSVLAGGLLIMALGTALIVVGARRQRSRATGMMGS